MTEGNDVGQVFPGLTIHGITLKLNFMIPFFREWCLALGRSYQIRVLTNQAELRKELRVGKK